MSNNNAVSPYVDATIRDVQEAAGVGQFYGATGWAVTMSGFHKQGNKVNVPAGGSVIVPFNEAFPKQVLGIFTQPGGLVSAESLTGFTLANPGAAASFYWWAIGV